MLILDNGKVVGCDVSGIGHRSCNRCPDAMDCKVTSRIDERTKSYTMDAVPAKKCECVPVNTKVPSVYENAATEIARLVEVKQSQYGNSFGNAHKILEILYPNGVPVNAYQDLLTVTRIIDKLFRIANGDQGDESAWRDINGYSLLSVIKQKL